MSPYASAARAYAAIGNHGRVTETDPHGLILLLFDGAIERIGIAIAAIARGDLAAKVQAIGKAMRIVESLRAALNLEAGGDLAAQLDGLYEYSARRMLAANVSNDAAALAEVHGLLAQVRAGWAGLAGRK